MTDLAPCRCEADINETFTIQEVWSGYGNNAYVAFCSYCNDAVAFMSYAPYESERVSRAAAKAWNSRDLDLAP